MAVVKPFAAIRPAGTEVQSIASLPYDVYTTEEAREITEKNPLSFLRIDRPEVNFPAGRSPYMPEVYNEAHDIFWDEVHAGDYTRDAKEQFYIYELTCGKRKQTGLVCLTAADDYENGVIKRHEETIELKETDRAHHIDIVNAQTGPVFLIGRRNDGLQRILEAEKKPGNLLYDFTADGVRQRIFRISDASAATEIEEKGKAIPSLYIADGHHRAQAAVRVCEQRRKYHPGYTGEEPFNYILSVIFPDDEVQSLDYNRVVRDLNDLDPDEFLASLLFHCDLQPVLELGGLKQMQDADPKAAMDRKHHEFLENTVRPQKKGEFSVYIGGRWYLCRFQDDVRSDDPVDGLDTALLQKYVMEDILDITDPRTNPMIQYVGGSRGLEELEEKCTKGGKAAFAMYPTSVEELMRAADNGRQLPPKSTWFEPKLLSGLFIHDLSE